MNIRVGFGYDIHELKDGIPFRLGGITITHDKGLKGHSDADVLIHALCDALLGACNLGDIGQHFPDTDSRFKGVDSKELLKEVVTLVAGQGYRIGNADCTVALEKPKISAYIPEMKKALAGAMNIAESDISIKATTGEKLGPIGREEGACAYAVVLIQKL